MTYHGVGINLPGCNEVETRLKQALDFYTESRRQHVKNRDTFWADKVVESHSALRQACAAFLLQPSPTPHMEKAS